MTDLRTQMIRIASELPKGDPARRKLLAAVSKAAASAEEKKMVADVAKKLRAKPSGYLGTQMDLSDDTHLLTVEKDPRGSKWAATIRLKGEMGTASTVASKTWKEAPSVADVVRWVKKQRLAAVQGKTAKKGQTWGRRMNDLRFDFMQEVVTAAISIIVSTEGGRAKGNVTSQGFGEVRGEAADGTLISVTWQGGSDTNTFASRMTYGRQNAKGSHTLFSKAPENVASESIYAHFQGLLP